MLCIFLFIFCTQVLSLAHRQQKPAHDTIVKPKVILDNDWGSTSMLDFLVFLKAGWDVMALMSSTADSWALQCGLHALALLELGNLSCIPVFKGSDYPILNTPELFQAWETVHGDLPWQGALGKPNLTAEAEGSDPKGGNPKRVVKEAFVGGYPNTTFASSLSAAEFMVQQVRKYPGQITIYAAGALTNVALAVRLDESFAGNCKRLVVMGGYINVNLLMATGNMTTATMNSDVNLMTDPDGAKIALTAAFPSIMLAGDATNEVISSSDVWSGLNNSYATLLENYYAVGWPFWDETTAAIAVDDSLIIDQASFYVDVDTSYASPTYGNIHAYRQNLRPQAQKLQEVAYPLKLDVQGVIERLRESLESPLTCSDLGY